MSPQELPTTPAKDLRTYIAVIRHQKWVIFVTLFVIVGATIFLTKRQTPLYTSVGRVIVLPAGTISNTPAAASIIDMPTESFIASSEEVAIELIEEQGLGTSTDDLLANLTLSIEPETRILVFAYTDSSPERAQQINQGFMDAYLALRRAAALERIKILREPYEAQQESLVKEIHRLEKIREPDSGELARLTNDLFLLNQIRGALRGLEPDPESGGRVSLAADLPTAPSSPSWPRNLTLATVLGFALGMGVALIREQLSEGLKGSEDLSAAVGAPVLAAIPSISGWRKRGDTQLVSVAFPKSSGAEAYRTLRTNLMHECSVNDLHVISVTSGSLGEGKTTTASNLAVTLAQTGKRVIVVSCDLRKPRLHRFFGLTNDLGVTSILSGATTLAQAAQRPEGIETLRVLASGPVPTNPAELLGSARMDALLDELRLFADLVIIDTPPILAVSDTLILAPKSDGVIVVADAHRSSKGATEHTREQLEQVGCNIIGCVFNNFDPSQAKYYPYDKRYYYSSYGYYAEKGPASLDLPSESPNGDHPTDESVEAPVVAETDDPSRPGDDMWR